MRQVVKPANLIVHIAVALNAAPKGGTHGALVVHTVGGYGLKRRRICAGRDDFAPGVFHLVVVVGRTLARDCS